MFVKAMITSTILGILDPAKPITYMGWQTTFSALTQNGWEITQKEAYHSRSRPTDSRCSHNYIYLRHSTHNLIGRIKIDTNLELEFLTTEHNQRITKKPVYVDREYTEEDIQPLLDIILKLQEKRPRKKKLRPSDKIIELFKGENYVEKQTKRR